MASSNRHWPSLFKSKPCSTRHHHQWQQHDMNHSSALAAAVAEEIRSPEPKPRWNPKPEQIRILESIFNSGMVNPPRDEIPKIRAQLQEYGEVGDANVFYWFQNRKSRSKHKLRHHLQSARSQAPRNSPAPAAIATSVAPPGPTSSSASSSMSTSPMVYCQAPLTGFLVEPFYLQGTQAFSFLSSAAAYPEQFGVSTGTPASIWSEVMLGGGGGSINGGGVTEQTKVDNKLENPNPSFVAASLGGDATPISKIQEPATAGIGGAARSMVFINEDAFEVMAGPLNIREAFGEEAILIHSSGHPVLTDQWGLTLHPLQHGASYYLV